MNAYEDLIFRLRHCPETVTAAECAAAIEELLAKIPAEEGE